MKHRRSTFLGHAAGGLGLVFCALAPLSAAATEGGTSHYLPGAVATLIDLAPTQPGWVIEPIYLHYEGDADLSKQIPVAGIDVLGLKATSDVLLAGGFYTFDQLVLGARYSIGAMLPYVWMTVEGEIETVLGDRRRRDTASGVGDLTLIPAMLAWKDSPWQYNAALSVYAPTGDVRHEVARVLIREQKDPVFCHRYPTGPCAGGNPRVRSARDTVASARWAGSRTAREGCDCQPHGGRELGLKDRVNTGEPLLSRRDRHHAKEADRHEPKGGQSGRGDVTSPRADLALPAVRRGLRPSGMVRVRNVVSPTVPTGIVEGSS